VASEADQGRRLARLEKAVGGLRQQQDRLLAQQAHTHRAVMAVVRRLFLDSGTLDYPQRLIAQRFRGLSQNEEDGITLAILGEAGVATATFAEVACGTNGGNSGFLAAELGWSGLMVDADPEAVAVCRTRFNPRRVAVAEAWVTRETINDLLEQHGITGEIDVLSIDIDGNDYWVWEAIEVCSPRLVIVECNWRFGTERAVVVPYEADFDRHDPDSTERPRQHRYYLGASPAAMDLLARRKGYRLVAAEPRGPNGYFLRDDVAPHIPAREVPDLFHVPWALLDGKRDEPDPVAEMYAYIEANSLPLVDVAGEAPRRAGAR
jgi:Methyltransferase FkbM domain